MQESNKNPKDQVMRKNTQANTSLQFLKLFGWGWLGLEIIVVMLSLILPAQWYLKAYLSDAAEESTSRFLEDKSALVPDEELGWRNRPNVSQHNWVIDEWAGRHHQPVTLEKPVNTHRVVFLGSSLINGSNVVDNQNTISAHLHKRYLEQQELNSPATDTMQLEALNFATMVYALDQVKIQAEKEIIKFKPDTLVIGLHEDPAAGLENMYIPFRLVDEEKMPFLKPRFISNMKSDQPLHTTDRSIHTPLTLIKPPLELLKNLDQNLLEFLKQYDEHYYNFARFQHFDAMPISSLTSKAFYKAKNFAGYWFESANKLELLRSIMLELEIFAKQHEVNIVYLYLPTMRALTQAGIWSIMPDYYQNRYNWISAPWSTEELASISHAKINVKPDIINIRDHLRRKSKALEQPFNTLLIGDNLHFSAQGNAMIAEIVLEHLLQSEWQQTQD